MSAAVRLWRHLFGPDHRLVYPPASMGAGRSPEPEAWPPDLGPRPPDPVFEWLGGGGGAGWLGDAEAHAVLAASGVRPSGPLPEIVSSVHDKAFTAEFSESAGFAPDCLRGLCARYSPGDLADPDAWMSELTRRLGQWPDWTRGRFTLKPRLGSSGRGRVGGRADALEPEKIRAALPRLARQGGALLEPWLRREADLSVMLHVAAQGGVTLLGSAQQIVAPSGVYLGHLGEVDSKGRIFSGGPWEEAMREAAAGLADSAYRAGYWGPCGVDGFAFRGPPGEDGGGPQTPILRPLVEFNARFTLGIVAGGLVRRALARAKPALGLEPGERRGFLFALDPPQGWKDWQSLADAAGDGTFLVRLTEGDAEPGHAGAAPAEPALLFAASAARLRGALRVPDEDAP